MARSFVGGVAVVGALVLVAGVGAKERPVAIEVCGVKACATVVALTDWGLPAWVSPDRSANVGPAAPAPFYVLKARFPEERSSTLAYYVPAAGLVKLKGGIPGLGSAIWGRTDSEATAQLRRATAGLAPFGVPRVSWAMTGNRWVKKPGSYLRLYALVGPPASDPAGPPPAQQYQSGDRETWFATWGPYLDSVKREWIRVQIGTRKVSPWGNLEGFVWVGRRADLLKRDGEVIQIPQVVAQRIRRGVPLGT